MIKSMTGFGKATGEWKNKKITIEIRSLNSKQMDLNIKMPSLYRSKELELRSYITKQTERGRMDVSIYVENGMDENAAVINKSLVETYIQQLKEIAQKTNSDSNDLLAIAMRMPDVFKQEREELEEEEWAYVIKKIDETIAAFNQFRVDEGNVLFKDFTDRINTIVALLKEIEQLEQPRIQQIRDRIKKNVYELIPAEAVDKNRFEQELIYYIEKLDITEEKVRLRSHCDYFLEALKSPNAEGRKLGFIAQEIGREINTIGSKANDAAIQKFVVQMKDELEKIKEQSLNVL
jgi:uncharacterized protein (TIGR00255 family)